MGGGVCSKRVCLLVGYIGGILLSPDIGVFRPKADQQLKNNTSQVCASKINDRVD